MKVAEQTCSRLLPQCGCSAAHHACIAVGTTSCCDDKRTALSSLQLFGAPVAVLLRAGAWLGCFWAVVPDASSAAPIPALVAHRERVPRSLCPWERPAGRHGPFGMEQRIGGSKRDSDRDVHGEAAMHRTVLALRTAGAGWCAAS